MVQIEIRSSTDAVIEGYVNAVERESRMLPSPFGAYTEKVESGTFQRAINRGNNIELRFNHDKVIGDTASGGLALKEDSIGLYAKATIADPLVIAKAKNGELRGWSFGFKDNNPKIGDSKRILSDIELREVSILDKTPAYIATSIELRGDDSETLEERGFEDKIEVQELEPVKSGNDVSYVNYEREIEILAISQGRN